MSTQEEVPTGKAAFAAARESVLQASHAQDQEPAPVEPPSLPPAEESPEVEDQPSEATESPDALLSDEQVAKLTPDQRKQYDEMNRAWTQKTQKLSAERKEMEQWKPLIDALTNDPDAALRQLAERRGMQLSPKAQEQVVAAAAADTLAELPEELQFLKPALELLGKTILDSVEGKLKPIAEAQTQMLSEAAAAETQATLEAFSAKYPGWEKHQEAMVKLGQKMIPTAGAMTDFEYMEMLHTLASAKESEADKTKKVVAKINKAAAASEQKTAGLSSERIEHAMPPPGKRSLRDAYEAAKRGEVWTK